MYRLGVVVKADTGVQHTGVRHILGYVRVFGSVTSALSFPVGKICRCGLVYLVVGFKPRKQHLKRRIGIYFVQFLSIGVWQTAYGDKGISVGTTTPPGNSYLFTCNKLTIVALCHDTAVNKFTH